MNKSEPNHGKRGVLMRVLAVLGPGIFAIGYTIGTGSVTSMAKAGADYGLGLVWVLALSCIFSGVLMEAYGRLAAVTGETSLTAIRRHLPFGRTFAWAVFAGVVIGQYTCLGGILTLSSGAISELLGGRVPPFAIAVVVTAAMYALLMIGRYSAFEKILALFVGIMALTFLVSVFVTIPDASTLARAARPLLPHDGASLLMLAAFVGTTMAAPTFVTRPLLVREKGLTASDTGRQRLDAWFSATLMFVISGSIVLVATGALWAHGKGIDRILDMAGTLEPLAGRAAVAIFTVGVLSAGLSSVFPILMVAPLLISDYRRGKMETGTPMFRWICLAACAWGLVVPALGGNPIVVTVAAQIANVFVLPLTVLAIILLLNKRLLMGEHRAGPVANVFLALAMVFSVAVACSGTLALCRMLF
ncbi:MAG: Nramp family divalent metal transporter [Kiritimatiellae bacterium]|nr:Nramp family divalent metal transporter [Kiritimatiellia bacterium]MBQ6328446.1 Nramp family divalent metal transporter [Kiritimatiellia bacterium]